MIGIGQVADAAVLIRQQGATRALSWAFSFVELLWAGLCVYLLFEGELTTSRWLAIAFVTYVPISIAVFLVVSPQAVDQEPEAIRIPLVFAYVGAIFGALYALGAVTVLLLG